MYVGGGLGDVGVAPKGPVDTQVAGLMIGGGGSIRDSRRTSGYTDSFSIPWSQRREARTRRPSLSFNSENIQSRYSSSV